MNQAHSTETTFPAQSAWPHIIVLPLVLIAVWVAAVLQAHQRPWLFAVAGVTTALVVVCLWGFFINTPNHSRVIVLFGRYRGTVRQAGWRVPAHSHASATGSHDAETATRF